MVEATGVHRPIRDRRHSTMKQVTFKFDNGDRVKDAISGFEGIVSARTQYLTGCIQYGISYETLLEGKVPDAIWMDEDRLTLSQAGAFELKVQTNGGPQHHPSHK